MHVKKAYHFKLGAVELYRDVAITWEHCCYIVKRGPTLETPGAIESARTLRDARTIAARLRRSSND